MFSSRSRYDKTDTYRFSRSDGSEVVIKKKRMVPDPPAKRIHKVQEGERTDLIAYRYYRDPFKYWKIADANEEMNPECLMDDIGGEIDIPANDPEKQG